jgi:signal transduction histidine kinase
MTTLPAFEHVRSQPPPGYSAGQVPLAEVIINDELERRGARPPNYPAENEALLNLADAMATTPDIILQLLSDTAMRLTRADSAGISLFEPDSDVFRWRATSGDMTRYLGGTMPRTFSPCGAVLDCNTTLLMQQPVLYFPYIDQLHLPIAEVLLVPFCRDEKPIGTIWMVTHLDRNRFDLEDKRLITSLTRFASAAIGTLNNLNALELAKKRLHEEREATERRRSEFLATLAHELRNPLSPIITGLEVLRLHDDPKIVADVRVVMQRQVGHLSRLVDDLLDSSRINSGKIELRKETVALDTAIKSAIEISQPSIDSGGHSFATELPVEAVFLDADPTRLTQIFSNLLNNAAKYTPTGGAIQLNARADATWISIDIIDNGSGISPDMLPCVFEMFTQDRRAQKHSQGGLGIGLAVVKQLTELHGGSIAVAAGPDGEGSVFTVRLPRLAEAKPESE